MDLQPRSLLSSPHLSFVSNGDRVALTIRREAHLPHIRLTAGSGSLAIVVEDGADASILLRTNKDPLEQQVAIVLQTGASLEITLVQEETPAAQLLSVNVTLGSSSRLRCFAVTLGSNIRQEIGCRIEGENASSDIAWISSANDTDRQELSALEEFLAPRSRGTIIMKSVARDKARLQSRGKITVGERGTNTDAFLAQHALVLDPTAEVDAVPALQIATDDVRASHAATVTNVSKEDLFYMTSRGIPDDVARSLAISGFLGELLPRIQDKHARTDVETVLTRKGAPLTSSPASSSA